MQLLVLHFCGVFFSCKLKNFPKILGKIEKILKSCPKTVFLCTCGCGCVCVCVVEEPKIGLKTIFFP